MSLQFSSHYGENVSVNNDFAEWKSTYSGGMCFAVLGKEPLKIKVCGSSHILLGYIEKDPNEIHIRDALNLLKRTSDIRVHKSTYKLSMRFSNDRKKLVLDSDNKKQERFSVENGRAWLGVYIQFGSASVILESTNSSFMKCHGENIKLSNNDTEATLIHENPAAFCYIDRPMYGGEAINLQIKPVSDPVRGKSSCLPSRFYLKFGFHKNNLFCEQWEPVHTLDRNKCLGKLQLGVSTCGDFIYATESGENGSFKIPEFERESGIVCVLELFRVNAKLNDVVVCPQYDYALNKGPFPQVPNSMDGPMEMTQKSSLESVSSTRILSITSEGDEVTENDEVFHETSAKESDKSHESVQKLKFMSERETGTKHDYEKTCTKPKSTTNDIFTGDCDLICNLSSTNSNTVVGNQIESSKPANTSISENDNSNSSVKLLNSKDVTPYSGLMNNMANKRQKKVLNIPPSSTGKRSSESDDENNSKADFCGTSISDKETDRNTDKIKLSSENSELKEQILTLKNENDSLKLENQRLTNEMRCLQEQLEQLSLGDNPNRPMSPNESSSNSTNLCKTIQLNFVKFVDDLEIPDLCDHLFQKGLISAQDLEYLHQKVNLDKRDANRHMFGLIKRRSIPYESFIDSLKATKQDGLAQLLKVSGPQLTT